MPTRRATAGRGAASASAVLHPNDQALGTTGIPGRPSTGSPTMSPPGGGGGDRSLPSRAPAWWVLPVVYETGPLVEPEVERSNRARDFPCLAYRCRCSASAPT